MRTLTLYKSPECHLCEQALTVLKKLQEEQPFELLEQDITADESLHRAYFERVPVVSLDGKELFQYFVDEQELRERLNTELA